MTSGPSKGFHRVLTTRRRQGLNGGLPIPKGIRRLLSEPKGRRLRLDNESYLQPLYPRPEPQKWALQASPIVVANTTEQG